MFDKTALAIAVIGAISRVIYTLVGLSGLWCISLLFRRDAVANHSHI